MGKRRIPPNVEIDPHKRVYTPAEVRAILPYGRDKVYRLLQSGTLRSIRIGRTYAIPASALDAFLAGVPEPQLAASA